MSRAQVWTARLSSKLSLHVNALLKKNALQERVLVAEHQTFIGSCSMGTLQIVQVGLMHANSLLELLDVLSTTLSESGLRLAIALLAFLRSSVNRLATTLTLRLLLILRYSIASSLGILTFLVRSRTHGLFTLFANVLLVLGMLGASISASGSVRLAVDGHLVGHYVTNLPTFIQPSTMTTPPWKACLCR